MNHISSINLKKVSHLAQRLRVAEARLNKVAESMAYQVRLKELPKPDGKMREVFVPSQELKLIQRRIYKELLYKLPLPSAFHGSVAGKSTITYVEPHIGKPFVACVDIKSFFPSIHRKRIYQLWIDYGCSPDVAHMLTRLTTHNHHVAQGFPTSPSLANLILSEFWLRLEGVCQSQGYEITVFLDDLTISGERFDPAILEQISAILTQHGFTAKPEKQRIMHSGERQFVTGWVINERVNLPREDLQELRLIIHKCQKFGVASVSELPDELFLRKIRGKIEQVRSANQRLGNKLLADFHLI